MGTPAQVEQAIQASLLSSSGKMDKVSHLKHCDVSGGR